MYRDLKITECRREGKVYSRVYGLKYKGVATAQFRFRVALSGSFQQMKLEYSATEEQCSQKGKHGSLPDVLSYIVCNLAYEEV